MRKLILLLSVISLYSLSFAQTVVWTETFSNGCTAACPGETYVGPNGAWTQTITGAEGANPNMFYVSCAENNMGNGNCGDICQAAPNPTLHISAQSGNAFCPNDCGAAYDAGGFCGILSCPLTDKRIESPTIDLTGSSTLTISFLYMEGGDGVLDNASFWYFDGATWTLLQDLAKTPVTCSPQGTWTLYSTALPASANNNANVKIGFRWVNNDDGNGSDPSFAVDDITITTPSSLPPTASFTTPATAICEGSCIDFTNTGTFAVGATFAWDFGNTVTSTLQNPTNICYPNPGSYTVSLTITDANGTDTEIMTNYIVVSSSSNAGTDNSSSLCNNTFIDLDPLLSGADAGGIWSETTGSPSGQFNAATGVFDATGLAAGVYTFNYTVAGVGACPPDFAVMTITVTTCAGPIADISASSLSICSGQSIIFNSQSTGVNISSYIWSFGSGLPGTANTAGPHSVTFNTPGTFNVWLQVTDDNGTDDQTIQITVTPCSAPTAAFGISDATICPGDCITYTNNSNTTGVTTYTWTFEGLTPSTYTTTNSTPITRCYNVPGTYDVTLVATNSFGTSSYSQDITVMVLPDIEAFIVGGTDNDTISIDPGQSVDVSTIFSEGNLTWSANPSSQLGNLACTVPDCSEITASPIVTTLYTVTTTTTQGCQASYTILIDVDSPDGGYVLGVPSMFSPDENGENDILLVRSFQDKLIADMVFRVYNRYGQMVFESLDPNDGWDGKFKGEPEMPATFVYTLEYTLYDGTTGRMNGNVTLVR